MRRSKPDDLKAFVASLDAATLSGVLLELAQEDDLVRQRLERLQLASRPAALAAAFKSTLTGWRRSERFIGYQESHAFGLELEHWLGQIERELLPRDPAAALALADALINSDATFFERADDSDGCIGDAVRAGCRLWLRAASKCKVSQDWTARLYQLASADDYGAREALLRNAHLLLDEKALRHLVERFDTELIAGVNAAAGDGPLAPSVFSASGSLHLLSEALGDPDVHVRAVLRYAPQPNALQREGFVRDYLAQHRPADALPWLEGDWGHLEETRLRLRAEALAALGQGTGSAAIRQQLFDKTAAVSDFQKWLELLPEPEHPGAMEHARQRADTITDPVTAATLLLEIGDERAAEAALVGNAERIDGRSYYGLAPLAEDLEARGLLRGATACYRALLLAILKRAYAPAYGHGARYFKKLGEFASRQLDLRPLIDHETFEAGVLSKHSRKVAFWSFVNGTRPLP